MFFKSGCKEEIVHAGIRVVCEYLKDVTKNRKENLIVSVSYYSF